ncbi:MAG TPA: HAD-IIIA family hydrolase [Candidatus Dormibacteraeota bacterium]
MLYLFDMDGTLRRALPPFPSPIRAHWQRILPGRRERLEALHDEGHQLGAASNQTMVAMGIVSFRRCEEVMERTNVLLRGRLRWIRFCPHHPIALRPQFRRRCPCRKPAPGLLLEALEIFGVTGRAAVYVGNGTQDQQAARGAGMAFVSAHDFFERRSNR